MSEEEVQVKIKVEKEGAGAQQAKTELDGLKNTATDSGDSTNNLTLRLHGFRTILASIGPMARGGSEAVSGFSRAMAGIVTVLSNTAWGKIAMIAATVASIGVNIYQSFKPAKEALDTSADAAANLDKKIPKDLGQPGIPSAIEYAKQLTDHFDKATAAAERTRNSMDELSDANLALKLANIDREVAAGGMTEDQGKQARIEARLSHEQEKIAREKATVQDTVARGEQAIATTSESYAAAASGIAETEAEIRKRGYAPGFAVTPDQLAAAKPGTSSRQIILEVNALQKRLEEQKKEAADRLKAYDTTREKLSPEIETGKARLGTLDVLSQSADVSASAQSLTVASSTFKAKDEAEAKQAADRAAYNAKVQAEQEKRRVAQDRTAKSSATDRATQILSLQQAEAESAGIQLKAAERNAGDKKLSPRERAQAKQELAVAQSRWNQEHTEVAQASAIQGKIRDAVNPDDVAKLLAALESIGGYIRTIANSADTQASQIKNGGLRTK